MAFEEQIPGAPPPPAPQPPTKKRHLDSAALWGTIIGILLLALILFIFRNQISAKIAEWRGSGQVASTVPNLPSISPAPTTPTPTATVSPTPKPTATPKTSTKPAGSTNSSTGTPGSIPTTGPEDSLLVIGLVGGSATAGLAAARNQIYRRRLKNQREKIDIL